MKHTGQSRHVLLLRVWVLLLLLLQPSSSSSTRARPAAAAAAAATQQQHCCIEAPAHVAKQLHSASWQPAAAHSNILQAVRENSTLQEQLPRAPEALLSRGYKGLAPAVLRNWRQLADKLNTPWSNVTVVTFGGSITAGYIDDAPNSSWVDPLMTWFKESYPAVNFTVVNLARSGNDVTPAAMCWYQLAPQDADLILVEYSVNGCVGRLFCHSFVAPRVANYETLIRRLINRAPAAAFLSVAAFRFVANEAPLLDANGNTTGANLTLPNPFYGSGQDSHARIAHHYGIPVASIRDALYDVMFDDQLLLAAVGMTRRQLLSASVVHPSTAGHILYSQIIAYTVQLTLKDVLRATSNGGVSLQQQQPQTLPPPISPLAAAEAGLDPFCAESAFLQQFATNSSGWTWEAAKDRFKCPHPNCYTYGFHSFGTNSTLQLTIDTQNSTRADGSTQIDNLSLVGIFLAGKSYARDWASRMGLAQLSCMSGCSCEPVLMQPVKNATGGEDFSGNLAFAKTQVTPHPVCVVKVTIIGSGATATAQEFFFNGIAVVPYARMQPLSPIDKRAIRAYAAISAT